MHADTPSALIWMLVAKLQTGTTRMTSSLEKANVHSSPWRLVVLANSFCFSLHQPPFFTSCYHQFFMAVRKIELKHGSRDSLRCCYKQTIRRTCERIATIRLQNKEGRLPPGLTSWWEKNVALALIGEMCWRLLEVRIKRNTTESHGRSVSVTKLVKRIRRYKRSF